MAELMCQNKTASRLFRRVEKQCFHNDGILGEEYTGLLSVSPNYERPDAVRYKADLVRIIFCNLLIYDSDAEVCGNGIDINVFRRRLSARYLHQTFGNLFELFI